MVMKLFLGITTITLWHWRRFSRAFAPDGAAAPKRRGSAACTVGMYDAPAMPENYHNKQGKSEILHIIIIF